MKTITSLCLVLVASVARADVSVVTFDGSSWNKEIADHGNIASISMTLDSSDRPHISFFGQKSFGAPSDLWYVRYDGSNWQSTLVDPSTSNTSYGTSIKLTSFGEPRISYRHFTRELRYASFSSGVWTTGIVDTPDVGGWSSLALDSLNNPHISYYDFTNQDLKLAVKSGIWSTEIVDIDGGIETSIQLFDGKEHISYGGNFHLRFAERSDSWNLQTVAEADTNTTVRNSLALDALGNPRISYWDFRLRQLKYAEWNPNTSSWDISLVDSGGQGNSLAIDADGTPHISYKATVNVAELRYATRDASGNWMISILDRGIVTETSIALDSQGQPVIAYNWRNIPEPSTLVLAGAASAVALIWLRRRTPTKRIAERSTQ